MKQRIAGRIRVRIVASLEQVQTGRIAGFRRGKPGLGQDGPPVGMAMNWDCKTYPARGNWRIARSGRKQPPSLGNGRILSWKGSARVKGTTMTTASITIEVAPEAAQAFAQASEEDKRKWQLLLSLRLQDLTAASGKSLKAIMDEIGAKAEARGLTPEILDSILHDNGPANGD
jgi:hypothetical protein